MFCYSCVHWNFYSLFVEMCNCFRNDIPNLAFVWCLVTCLQRNLPITDILSLPVHTRQCGSNFVTPFGTFHCMMLEMPTHHNTVDISLFSKALGNFTLLMLRQCEGLCTSCYVHVFYYFCLHVQ